MGSSKLATAPWGETAVLLGLWLGLASFLGPRLAISPTAEALGADGTFTDVGNAFEKAAEVASYADERLVRAVATNALPTPPRIVGDAAAARVAWGYAILSAGLFAGIAVVASGRGPRRFGADAGLGRANIDGLWVPATAVAVVYLAAGAYAQAVDALGIDVLQTEPGGLEVTLRDGWALALYGITTVVAAPLGEELFYRGLIFRGLGRWGFGPAAFVSSTLFALSHVDAATIVPFLVAGVAMCWLYWRSGSLWDAIAFHVIFNFLSFILLLART